jgi:hypothetical protein
VVEVVYGEVILRLRRISASADVGVGRSLSVEAQAELGGSD